MPLIFAGMCGNQYNFFGSFELSCQSKQQMNFFRILAYGIFFLVQTLNVNSQSTVFGTISDTSGNPVSLANIAIKGTGTGTMSALDGRYSLQITEKELVILVVSCVGFENIEKRYENLPGSVLEINFTLTENISELDEVSVSARYERLSAFSRIELKELQLVPSTTGGIESLIKTLPGVSSNNELSSQYSVRGGNYDENLIYVNDIEIYRPFLVRSGQQEGLSFINSDMISSIRFSAGGFDASFGDKMSSVLDITYRKPTGLAGSVSASLLGGSIYLEGTDKTKRFSYLTGSRYKSNTYLLNSLPTTGNYSPRFTDFQGLFSYRISEKSEISFLGNLAINQYDFIPKEDNIDFGTSNKPLNLTIYYEGQERDRFDTYMGAVTYKLTPSKQFWSKLILSGYQTIERETFDILGEYLINELDNTIGSKTYGDSILNIGIGGFLNHARNYLEASVYSVSYMSEFNSRNHKTRWGAGVHLSTITDRLSEWEMVDSTGFSVPADTEELELYTVVKSSNSIQSGRYSAFFQDTWTLEGELADFFITTGVRGTYLDLNEQMLISPRMSLSLKPSWLRDFMFHVSGGVYFQPPFYREMRDPEGNINTNLKSQRSFHAVTGGDYIFQAWERPFKLTAEIYYKDLAYLVPYKVDNVRIKYSGKNQAKGYAMGLDIKLNGEFVKNAESWVSLSLMQTREDIDGDYYYRITEEKREIVYPGYYPRSTDQLFTFGLYFQDYLPNNPDYKVHLNFLYGSRLPYSSPGSERYDELFRIPPYRRVDIGFSKILKKENDSMAGNNPFRHLKNIWLSAEVFNLLDINNTISYQWVRTISNQEGIPGIYAVPNYLTSRRFNIKLSSTF